jgi:large repetitive protein
LPDAICPSRIYWNDGKGQLTTGPAIGIGSDDTRPIGLGDVDGDGDIDIITGNDCQPNVVFFNSIREAVRTVK